MKKLILFELLLIFLATTFESDSPPGWFQQTIPIGNKQITDIQFLDSLNGWVITNWNPSFDTAYIFRTTNGGSDWLFQLRYPASFTAISMVNLNTGYVTGGTGFGRLFKTSNSGLNWNLIYTAGHLLEDVYFVNADTGWICDEDISGAGLLKTTNGGANWIQQLSASFRTSKLFFINSDTGWAACQNVNLYRTTNGGQVWTLQFTFTPFDNDIKSIFFINGTTGYTTHYTTNDSNGIYITSNGGFNWTKQRDVDPFSSGLGEIFFNNLYTGYIATGFSKIIKTTNSGINWFKQSGPVGAYGDVMFTDTSKGWAGGTIVIHTDDGGGPPVGISQTSNEVPFEYKLGQNYPNPFNGMTNVKFQMSKQGNVQIKIFDISGREISLIVNEILNAGEYKADWNASGFASGIYFYSLIIDNKVIETKKMILIK